jgi:hypothetical protein
VPTVPLAESEGAEIPAALDRRPKRKLPPDFPDQAAKDAAIRYWTSIGRADLCDSAETEFEAFRDHHTAQATSSADWCASLRTWTRNAAKWNKRPIAANGQAKSGIIKLEDADFEPR